MSTVITNKQWYKELPKHVMVARQFCLTSPVTNYMPPMPQADIDYEASDIPITEMHVLRMDLNRCPQLAFTPKRIHYVGPILGRLAHYKVVCATGGRWMLEPSILESWKWLEITLTHAISALSADCLLPMPVGFIDYPDEWGYTRDHKKVGQATMCVKASRSAFVALLGLFSMFYSFRASRHHHYRLDPSSANASKESPRDIMKSKTSLDDRTIQSLEDMHALLPPRVGVVINPVTNQWAQQYQFALAWAAVDHWYYWTYPLPAPTSLWSQGLAHWRPDINLIKPLYDKLLGSSKQNIISSPPHNLSNPPNPPTQPKPPTQPNPPTQSNAGAASHSPFNAFFGRREASAKSLKDKASPSMLDRYESRRKSAKEILEKLLPPNQKSKVFHWVEMNGVRVRTNVVRGEWDLVWEYDEKDRPRSRGQKRYCEYTDEWDVCTEFDESSEVGPVSRGDLTALDELFEDDGGDDPRPFGPTILEKPPLPTAAPPCPPALPPPPEIHANPQASKTHVPHDSAPPVNTPTRILNKVIAPPPPLPADYNQLGAGFNARHAVTEVGRTEPPLDEILYVRFGLNAAAVASDLRLGAIRLNSDALTLDEVAAILMEKYGSAASSTKDAVRYIVTALQREKSIAPQYWDLHAQSPEPLKLRNQGYFNFFHVKTHLDSDKAQVLEGYEVLPTNPRYERSWTVMLDSPIAVTHCIRGCWGPSLEDVVERAVREGYRIRVLRRRHKDQLSPRSEPPVLLGRRERNTEFKATKEDYTSFLSVVELLMEQPRFISVVFRGGILARICQKFTHTEDLLNGPSLDAERHGLRWVGLEDHFWLEDYVSEAEVELLIGMFYVATGKCRPNQFAKRSFFPSPSVWETSGLNTRLWSNSAEEKYESILRSVTESDAASFVRPRLLTTAEWRHTLRLFRNKTQNFLTLVEDTAKAVIGRGLS